MPANVTTPFSQPQFQGWASFFGGNVQAPQAPPPSAFGAGQLGQPPTNGQYTGGWAYPDAWANFYAGKQGFQAPQSASGPSGALAATYYANNINNPNDPNLLGWERVYGNPQTVLQQDQDWAKSLGNAPLGTPSNQLTGGWQNPEAWAAYYGGTNGFAAQANAGSPASALAAASQIAKTSNPQSNPALLGWVQDYGQPGSVLANTPNWAASLGTPQVNAQGQGVGQTNTQGWESPLAWAAYYGGFQGYGQPVDNTLQAAQNWAGVTNKDDPSLLGWELDYGNPQTVISQIQASPQYQAALQQQQQQQQQALQQQQQADQAQALGFYNNEYSFFNQYYNVYQTAFGQGQAAGIQAPIAPVAPTYITPETAAQEQDYLAYIGQYAGYVQAYEGSAAQALNAQQAQTQQTAAAPASNAAAQQQAALIASLTSQEQDLQTKIKQLQSGGNATAANYYINQLQGIQAQLGQAQTQLSALPGSAFQQPAPIGSPQTAPGFIQTAAPTAPSLVPMGIDPITGAKVPLIKIPLLEQQEGNQSTPGSMEFFNGVLRAVGGKVLSGGVGGGLFNTPGSGTNIPSFGTNNIEGVGGAAGAFGLSLEKSNIGNTPDLFNQLYGNFNTTFAQAFTAGETTGGMVPPGAPIMPFFGGKGGEGGKPGAANASPADAQWPYAGLQYPQFDLTNFPQQVPFLGAGGLPEAPALLWDVSQLDRQANAPPVGVPTGTDFFPNVDDFGRPIPDVGPPQPFNLPDFGGLVPKIARSNVDLPQPLGPTRETVWPGRILRFTLLRTFLSPKECDTFFTSRLIMAYSPNQPHIFRRT